MAEFPALTLWTDAYLSDTRHLSTVEHGAYLLLLMEAWRRPHCDIPDDDRLLARFVGLPMAEWEAIKPIILAFWKRDGRAKVWKQKRLTLERDRARNRTKVGADNAAKRWNKKEKSDATALPDECKNNATTATAITTAIKEEEGSVAKATVAAATPDDLFPEADDRPELTAIDVTKVVFDTGRGLLKAMGKTDDQARSIIGKWRRTYTDGTVLAVLARCQREEPEHPIEWIAAGLKSEKNRAGADNVRNQDIQRSDSGRAIGATEASARRVLERVAASDRAATG